MLLSRLVGDGSGAQHVDEQRQHSSAAVAAAAIALLETLRYQHWPCLCKLQPPHSITSDLQGSYRGELLMQICTKVEIARRPAFVHTTATTTGRDGLSEFPSGYLPLRCLWSEYANLANAVQEAESGLK